MVNLSHPIPGRAKSQMQSCKSCMSIREGLTFIMSIKNIEANMIFLITSQNEAMVQCKQIRKVE